MLLLRKNNNIHQKGENKMKSTKNLALGGLLIALVTIGTMTINVPMPATNGYINIGDSMIFMIAILFGSRFGLLAGGIGSALADIFLGYTHWALPTLIIKGLEGFIVGKIAVEKTSESSLKIRDIIALLVGGTWMVAGYYVGGAILKGSWLAPLDSVGGNIIQAIGGGVIAYPIIFAILKTSIVKVIKEN